MIMAMLQDVYGQSLDDGYEYSQAVYDEDDEQPVARRTSYSQYQQSDPERRISQMSHYSNQDTSPQVFAGQANSVALD